MMSAHLAWENLKTIYKPISAAQKHALEQAFNHCTLTNSNTKPDEWFSELQHLRTQLLLDHEFTISDEQMISQILYNISPPMYQKTVAIIKHDLQRKITITLPELQADLRHLYSQHELLKGNSFTPRLNGGQGRGRGDNATMLAVYPTQVKSNCNLCGKRGHKSVDCWDHPRNINKRWFL
jgi:hypothetical protein